LAGERKVDVAVQDPLFAGYIRDFLFEDAGRYIPSIPGMDMDSYKEALMRRFSNSTVGDQLGRLCLDGGSKIPGFIYPTLKANLEEKGTCPRLAFLLASYNHYIRSKSDDKGLAYEIREPNAMDIIAPIIANDSPLGLLETTILVGDAARFPRFVEDYSICFANIQKAGVYNTLRDLKDLLICVV